MKWQFGQRQHVSAGARRAYLNAAIVKNRGELRSRMDRVQHHVTSPRLEHPEHRRYRGRAVLEQKRDRTSARRRRICEQSPADTVRLCIQLAVAPLMRTVADRQRRRPARRLGLEAGDDRLLDFAVLEEGESVGRPRASAAGRVRGMRGRS